MTTNQVKTGRTIWKDIITPRYKTLGRGMPIGLLLTLTYNQDYTFQIN